MRSRVGSQRLRDLGSAHPLFAGTRVVSEEAIADELEADIRTINPPVTQGWMVGVLVLAAVSLLPVVRQLDPSTGARDMPAAVVGVIVSFAGALASIVFASTRIGGLELRGDDVIVRSWLETRLRRPGANLGRAESVSATVAGDVLAVTGTGRGAISLSMRAWPPSARRDVIDELPIWGVKTPFGPRRSRRAQRDRRREESIARRAAEQDGRRHRQ